MKYSTAHPRFEHEGTSGFSDESIVHSLPIVLAFEKKRSHEFFMSLRTEPIREWDDSLMEMLSRGGPRENYLKFGDNLSDRFGRITIPYPYKGASIPLKTPRKKGKKLTNKVCKKKSHFVNEGIKVSLIKKKKGGGSDFSEYSPNLRKRKKNRKLRAKEKKSIS